MKNQKTTDLVYLSLFLTIIVVMSQVPWLGFIPLGFTTATIIHIPVIIAAIYFGKKIGALTGLVFGVASLVTAYIRPTGVFDLFFQNPVISVLPRIAFGFLAAMIYEWLRVIKNNTLRIGVTALLSSLVHSVLVIGTLIGVYYNRTKTFITDEGVEQSFTISLVLLSLVFLSVIAEAVVSTLITTPVVKALHVTKGEKLQIDFED